jgi:hypothetical protein
VSDARLTLIVRAYCHLCDDMRDALRALMGPLPGGGVGIDEIDVDSDPALEARWGDKVPVLLAGDRELCHFTLDRAVVRRALGAGGRAGSQ